MYRRFPNVSKDELQLRNGARLVAGIVVTMFLVVIAVLAPSGDTLVADNAPAPSQARAN